MVTEFGDNLHVLLIPDIGEDWEIFASWYSVNKNLPYASVSLIYNIQEGVTPFQIFQWSKRLNIPTCGLLDRKDKMLNLIIALYKTLKEVNKPILFLSSLSMVLKPLDSNIINIINNPNQLIWDQGNMGVCTMGLGDLEEIWNKYVLTGFAPNLQLMSLISEANETDEPKSLISYNKGCGKWIHKKVGCPFASAGGLVKEVMTVNEQKIVDLWRKMVPLYSSIN